MSLPTPQEAIISIIEWTDCEGLPDDPAQRLEFYARRMLLIRNAARASQQEESPFKVKFMDGSPVPIDYINKIHSLVSDAADGDPGEANEHGECKTAETTKKYIVDVIRSSCSKIREIEVDAKNPDEARKNALDIAGNYNYSESDADYLIEDVREIVKSVASQNI